MQSHRPLPRRPRSSQEEPQNTNDICRWFLGHNLYAGAHCVNRLKTAFFDSLTSLLSQVKLSVTFVQPLLILYATIDHHPTPRTGRCLFVLPLIPSTVDLVASPSKNKGYSMECVTEPLLRTFRPLGTSSSRPGLGELRAMLDRNGPCLAESRICANFFLSGKFSKFGSPLYRYSYLLRALGPKLHRITSVLAAGVEYVILCETDHRPH
jgi:hypothetical protein